MIAGLSKIVQTNILKYVNEIHHLKQRNFSFGHLKRFTVVLLLWHFCINNL